MDCMHSCHAGTPSHALGAVLGRVAAGAQGARGPTRSRRLRPGAYPCMMVCVVCVCVWCVCVCLCVEAYVCVSAVPVRVLLIAMLRSEAPLSTARRQGHGGQACAEHTISVVVVIVVVVAAAAAAAVAVAVIVAAAAAAVAVAVAVVVVVVVVVVRASAGVGSTKVNPKSFLQPGGPKDVGNKCGQRSAPHALRVCQL